jgi:anti-sigma B factor antagonist
MERLSIRTSLHASPQGDRYMVVLDGALDVASAPLLERTLADLCRGGAKEIVVDMGGVEFTDSSGMNAILRTRIVCKERDCDLSLTPARGAVRRVFEITRVLEKLPFHKSGASSGSAQDAAPRAGELEIRDEAHGGRHTLVLAGQLDVTTSVALERVTAALCKSGASEIVLDLRQLDLLDSSGVRAVVAGQESCREQGCEFFLTPGRQAIERLFEVVGLPRDAAFPQERPSSAM